MRFEDLLHHSGFVEALARSLVDDAHRGFQTFLELDLPRARVIESRLRENWKIEMAAGDWLPHKLFTSTGSSQGKFALPLGNYRIAFETAGQVVTRSFELVENSERLVLPLESW
jgi:hypothetical protein